MKSLKIHKYLFYLLVLLMPVNLGKHFVFRFSYVKGLLIDYLVPVIFLQDILVVAVVAFWFVSAKSRKINQGYLQLLLLFLVSVGLSVVPAALKVPSVLFYIRLVFYALFSLYIASELDVKADFPVLVRLFSFVSILLGVLGILQWFHQGSIFDNYLILGEQPYSSATRGVAVQNFFGIAKVPAYGIFRHPNIFGGFLCIVFIWFIYDLFNGRKTLRKKLTVLLTAAGILVTGSQAAWAAAVLGLFFLVLIKFKGKLGVLISLIIGTAAVTAALFIPVAGNNRVLSNAPSIYRRADLQKAAYEMIKEKPFFGVGANNFTAVAEDYMAPSKTIRFAQPVHNIFVLVFSESGVFSFVSFIALFFTGGYLLLKQSFGVAAVFFISLLQIAVLGSLDHYFYTIHQTALLFWLVFGMIFSLSRK